MKRDAIKLFFLFFQITLFSSAYAKPYAPVPGHFETIIIWAEENGGINPNSNEWSFGNGSTGQIGIPIINDWEIYGMSLQVLNATGSGSVTVAAWNRTTNTQFGSAEITGTAAGSGGPINATITFDPTIIPVSSGDVIGFRTTAESGTLSNARVAVWLRRQID